MDIFDIEPQKFYLLSPKRRALIDFSLADHSFAQEVDDLFDSIKAVQGGNIRAVYCYTPLVLEAMQAFADKYKDQYPNVQQLPKYFKYFEEGDYFIRQRTSVSILDLKRSILETDSRTLGIDVKKTDDIFVQNWGLLCLSYDVYSFCFNFALNVDIQNLAESVSDYNNEDRLTQKKVDQIMQKSNEEINYINQRIKGLNSTLKSYEREKEKIKKEMLRKKEYWEND